MCPPWLRLGREPIITPRHPSPQRGFLGYHADASASALPGEAPMKRLSLLCLAAAVTIGGCGKEAAPAGDTPAAKGAGKAPAAAFARHQRTADLIIAAGTKCEKVHFNKPDCPEEAALVKFKDDLWMTRIPNLQDPEKLQILGTALDLLGHENWKVRGFAVRIVMNDIMRLFEKIYANPSLLPKRLVEGALDAIPNLKDSLDNGWLMQDIAKIVPAYGLTDKMFQVAEANLKINESLVGYALHNVVTYSKLKHFDKHKQYSADIKRFPQYLASINAIASIRDKLTPAELEQVCAWQKGVIPAAWPEEYKANVPWGFSELGYRYAEIVVTCKDFSAVERLKRFDFYTKVPEFTKNMQLTVSKLELMKKLGEAQTALAAAEKEGAAPKVEAARKEVEKLKGQLAALK
jgi:hypothetical protein